MAGALATGSRGNSKLPSVSFFRPARSTSWSKVRLTATMPPMPCSVKPMPSGIGRKSSAVMKMIIEKPGRPSGICVAISPKALSVMVSCSESCITPA